MRRRAAPRPRTGSDQHGRRRPAPDGPDDTHVEHPDLEVDGRTLRLARAAPVIARLAAQELDAYAHAEALHSRAL